MTTEAKAAADLTATRYALERTKIMCDVGAAYQDEATLSASEINDLIVCRDSLDSLLASPADHVEELLGDLEWKEFSGRWGATTVIGPYVIYENCDWRFQNRVTSADSIEAAKAACWSDYVSRMRAAFKGGGK